MHSHLSLWVNLEQEFEKRIEKERKEMLYRDHLKEQDWLIEMRDVEDAHVRKTNEFDLRLRLLQKRILMAESEKEVSIQSLLESQAVTLKEMNDEYEKKVRRPPAPNSDFFTPMIVFFEHT